MLSAVLSSLLSLKPTKPVTHYKHILIFISI